MDKAAWRYEFAKRLRQAMNDRDMSATELSEASGVGKSDISNYLKAKYKPKQDKVYLLAGVLNVDPVWLYALDMMLPDTGSDECPSDRKKELISQASNILNSLPEEQLEAFVSLFRKSVSTQE